MALDLFKYHYVRQLRAGVGTNLLRYTERKPWADRKAGEKIHLPCALETAAPLELEMPVGKDLKDFENAKIVHRAFPNLTPLQARDPRLWTKLAHVECWAYMRKRWDATKHLADPGKAGRYVLEHYFVPQAQSRALLRNGIARLWWYGHLTHDPARANPYELTETLLSYLDIAQQVLERNMGRAPHVRTGVLDFIRLNEPRLGGNAGCRRAAIRRLAKMLNLRGGVTILDALTVAEVDAVLQSELGLPT